MAEEAVPLTAATVQSAVPPTVGTSGSPKVMNACGAAATGSVVPVRPPLSASVVPARAWVVPATASLPPLGAIAASGSVTGVTK